jgi:hypothetical protein
MFNISFIFNLFFMETPHDELGQENNVPEISAITDASEAVQEAKNDTIQDAEAELGQENAPEIAVIAATEVVQEANTDTNEALATDESQEDEHLFDEKDVDYTALSKIELVELAESLAKNSDFQKADAILRKIKPLFDDKKETDRNEALAKFVAEGGEEGDFKFRDDAVGRFNAAFGAIRDKRKKQIEDAEKSKQQNLVAKKALLEQLKSIVENENAESMAHIKKIQEEWKAVGPVPAAEAQNLSANYGVLLDRYYNNRHIYFELKELDRRKNLEAKLEICERAEKLLLEPSLNKAVKELNDLHEEYKNIGPAPKVEQEALWVRFKEVSDKIYNSRREYVENIRKEQDSNLQAKTVLCERSEQLVSFSSDRIDDWNSKTEELMALQKEWNAVGSVSRNKGADIAKKFWGNFKVFFANKSAFFKKLEESKQANLDKKTALCEQAEALSNSEEWESAANQLKELQNQWKLVGPVPNKFRNSIMDRFKQAADTFFNRKRAHFEVQDAEQAKNLAVKVAVCEKMEQAATDKKGTWEELQAMQKEFDGAGFVPRKEKDKIQQRYLKAIDNYIVSSDDIDAADKPKLRLTAQVRKGGRNAEVISNVRGQEQNVRRQITQLENDIHLWRNNLGFFANSRNIDALRKEVDKKVAIAEREIDALKEQLRIIAEINN